MAGPTMAGPFDKRQLIRNQPFRCAKKVPLEYQQRHLGPSVETTLMGHVVVSTHLIVSVSIQRGRKRTFSVRLCTPLHEADAILRKLLHVLQRLHCLHCCRDSWNSRAHRCAISPPFIAWPGNQSVFRLLFRVIVELCDLVSDLCPC